MEAHLSVQSLSNWYVGLLQLREDRVRADPQWSEDRQTLIRAGYHIASVGWGLLVSVHAEETLYWAFLIGSIRRRDSQTWFQSRQFKIWVLCVITVSPITAYPATQDPINWV